MQTPTLRDVLWVAQDRGRCWICNGQMSKKDANKNPKAATLDHLWPRKHFGRIGDVGLTLLACKACNTDRGHTMPSDDDIRTLVRVYRKIPAWWLEMAAADAARQATAARVAELRRDICSTFVRAAA